MKNKKLLVTLIVIAVVVVVAVVAAIFVSIKYLSEEDLGCAAESETVGPAGMPKLCCEGLTSMGGFRGGYQGECDVLPPPTGINTCSNCGDGYCDTYNGENKCNCSQDCQKEGDNVFCTADAKLCSDGSYVGKDSNNNCEYISCPEIVSCDASITCPKNYDCYKYEDQDSAICYQGNPCFQCDSHTCNIAESYPMQIFCQ